MADETSTETTTETQAQAGAEGHEQGTETLLSGDDGQNKAQDKKAEEEKSHTDELKSTDSPTPSDPEKFDLSMPEGYGDVERAEFVKIAKDLGLTEEQTQKLADHSASIRAATLDAQRAARNRQVDDWNKALREDKEFGGAKFSENAEYFRRGVRHLDEGGELTTLLEETGYGSHPAVVKAVARIGRQLDEDKIIGRGVTADDKQLAERYFNK